MQLLAHNLLAGLRSTVAIYGVVLAVFFGYIGSSLLFGEDWDMDATMGGVGIPPEKVPSLFERFFHGDDSVRGKGKGEGRGLGLHIVKHLVEAQSGTILAESSLGQGTVFRFRLPRAVKPSGRRSDK